MQSTPNESDTENNSDKIPLFSMKQETLESDEESMPEELGNFAFSEIPMAENLKEMLSTAEMTLGFLDKIVENVAFWLLQKGDPIRSKADHARFVSRMAQEYEVLEDTGFQVRAYWLINLIEQNCIQMEINTAVQNNYYVCPTPFHSGNFSKKIIKKIVQRADAD